MDEGKMASVTEEKIETQLERETKGNGDAQKCQSCSSSRCSPCLIIWGTFALLLILSALFGK